MKYTVLIEAGKNNYSAYVPELPGCVATGRTREELMRNMKEAIEIHIEGMLKDGEPIPRPFIISEQLEVAVQV